MTVDISDIERIITEEETWRQTQTINLIASENTPSDAVRRVQNSDFMGRYAEGHPNEDGHVNRYYQGTHYIDQIERMAHDEIVALFQAKQADVRPISGNAANTALALAYLRGGDTVLPTRPMLVGISAMERLVSLDAAFKIGGSRSKWEGKMLLTSIICH